MQYFFGTLIFLFGAAIGSFMAVIANRYNTGLPFLKGRSVCFSCNTQLQKWDLVPIFSFLFLKGRCRYCQSKIPKEVFMTEILMGFLSIFAAFKSSFWSLELRAESLEVGIGYLMATAIFAAILLISIYDLKHFIIPDSFLISLFIFALSSKLLAFGSFSFISLSSKLLALSFSGLALTTPFLLIFLVSRGTWLGFGDVKYIAVLGFWLGFAEGLSAVILAFWIGAAFALIALFLKKVLPRLNLPLIKNNLTIKSEIPFGPFLSLGAILSFCLSLDIFKINELFF